MNTLTDYNHQILTRVCDRLIADHLPSRTVAKPTPKQPTHSTTIVIEIEVELDLFATWHRGFPGSREEPAEPAGYELDSYRATWNGFDVTDYITDDEVNSALADFEQDQRSGAWDHI